MIARARLEAGERHVVNGDIGIRQAVVRRNVSQPVL